MSEFDKCLLMQILSFLFRDPELFDCVAVEQGHSEWLRDPIHPSRVIDCLLRQSYVNRFCARQDQGPVAISTSCPGTHAMSAAFGGLLGPRYSISSTDPPE